MAGPLGPPTPSGEVLLPELQTEAPGREPHKGRLTRRESDLAQPPAPSPEKCPPTSFSDVLLGLPLTEGRKVIALDARAKLPRADEVDRGQMQNVHGGSHAAHGGPLTPDVMSVTRRRMSLLISSSVSDTCQR